MSKKTPLELGKRERQIFETVQRLREASVAQVREQLATPPSYSAVRTMLGLLVQKGWLKRRAEGKRYLYRPAGAKEQSYSALRKLLSTFFGGSPGDAMAALLDISANELSGKEVEKIKGLIDRTRIQNRKSK